MKISFIGSGNVASNTAFISGINGLFNEMVMLDISENFAIGKAMDLEQGFILCGNNIKVIGTSKYEDVKNSDVVVITAGISNKIGDGFNRESLLSKNKEIITDVANKLKKVISTDERQPLIIMVTNPLDIILKHFIDIGNFNKEKTVGSGNWLDSGRFKYYLSKEFKIKATDIETFVVGQHGQKMVYLLSQTKIKGQPFAEFVKNNNISEEKVNEICNKATNGAYEIINLIAKDGTIFGPAVSIYNIVESYIKDLKKVLSVSMYCGDEYGISDYCIGYPVSIGKNGIDEVKILDISPSEREAIQKSFEFMKSLDK